MNELLTAAVIIAAVSIGGPAGMLLGHLAGRLTRAHNHQEHA